MCGIAGIFGNGNIEQMTAILSHRGPDDVGYFADDRVALGVRRLAIIDLKTGHQPIVNEDKTLILIFNGEIFNYLSLRKELISLGHIFTTETDSEVIIHAYEEYGVDCLAKFNGMFAFAIYEKQKRKLFIARDRLGEKPLYYTLKNDNFYFASEIKSLLTQVTAQINFDQSFFALESSFGVNTLFKEIYLLAPGNYMFYDGKNIDIRKYWDFPKEINSFKKESEYVEHLRWLLEDSVKIRLHSDVPLGVLLSGGLDSAIIACLAKPDKVFSCHYPYGDKYDELSYAKLVAEFLDTEHIVVTPTKEDFKDNLSKIMWHLDEPIATASPFSFFMLCREIAKSEVKVILSGEGADELFGGYVRYAMMLKDTNELNHGLFTNYQDLVACLKSNSAKSDLYRKYCTVINRNGMETPSFLELVKNIFEEYHAPLKAMAVADFKLTFPSLIDMSDKMTSAFGLESRSPFLDHRIVEFAFELPENLKIKEFTTKYILREAVRGLIPEKVRMRLDKKGLVSPINQWLERDLKSWKDAQINKLPQKYRCIRNNSLNRGEFDRSDYTKLCLSIWLDRFLN